MFVPVGALGLATLVRRGFRERTAQRSMTVCDSFSRELSSRLVELSVCELNFFVSMLSAESHVPCPFVRFDHRNIVVANGKTTR